VQHLLVEHAAQVLHLLLNDNGYLYICGDARMARDVQKTLCELIGQASSTSALEAEGIVRNMKSTGRFQVHITLPSLFMALDTGCPSSNFTNSAIGGCW
jgi:sulfite reductase alpha subunit-like flavoprotein